MFDEYLCFSKVWLIYIGFRLTSIYSMYHYKQSVCLRNESHYDGFSESYVWTSGKKHLHFHFITKIRSAKRHQKPKHIYALKVILLSIVAMLFQTLKEYLDVLIPLEVEVKTIAQYLMLKRSFQLRCFSVWMTLKVFLWDFW